MGPTVQLPGHESIPNSNSAPWIQAGPVTNPALVPSQSANGDDLLVEFQKRLDQITYDRLGIMPKHRTYVKQIGRASCRERVYVLV